MTTKDTVYIALFAALTAALGLIPQITLAAGVPITAQSMGVMLAGALLGAKRGGLAIVLFLALVAIGLPLLAGGRGGAGVFFGASGGFLLGFPLGAFVIGYLFDRHRTRPPFALALVYVAGGGIGVVYLLGVPWLAQVANLATQQALLGSLAFVPGDLIKVVLTVLIAREVRKALPDL
ncbi:biotin transporter BioY [Tritonibacter horizontis]|uniref:Biotin transporter n=1 Tax=Tritonibacter horizontis TaxID=1768241 RepID=A0A132BUB6_9RHOB|nr:biotin transporter BioY [Tritonibacter horizontis]KUP91943.1 biotin transporter BioY [Tritonibacter horizontis]